MKNKRLERTNPNQQRYAFLTVAKQQNQIMQTVWTNQLKVHEIRNCWIVITRPQIITKNRKVLWPVTWQSGYKKADFWSSNQFAFLWTENSFFGLPCLEFVILWSKTGSAQKGATPEGQAIGSASASLSLPPIVKRPDLDTGSAQEGATPEGQAIGSASASLSLPSIVKRPELDIE